MAEYATNKRGLIWPLAAEVADLGGAAVNARGYKNGRVASGSSVANGSTASSFQTKSGMGKRAHSRVLATRSGRLIPHTVTAMRFSRNENCNAAAPGGAPLRTQISSTRRTGASAASAAF